MVKAAFLARGFTLEGPAEAGGVATDAASCALLVLAWARLGVRTVVELCNKRATWGNRRAKGRKIDIAGNKSLMTGTLHAVSGANRKTKAAKGNSLSLLHTSHTNSICRCGSSGLAGSGSLATSLLTDPL